MIFLLFPAFVFSLPYNHKREWPQGMLTVSLHYRESVNLQEIFVKKNMIFIQWEYINKKDWLLFSSATVKWYGIV